MSASELWKGVTTVSSVGRKRGRGKGLRKRVDLNRGQYVGLGKKMMLLPGLNTKVYEKTGIHKIKPLGENTDYEAKLQSVRGDLGLKQKPRMHPLDRGFSGTAPYGRSIGISDELKEEFSDFDCKVILQRAKGCMIENVGRVRMVTTLVVVGNQNGLVGFAKARSRDFRKAASSARAKALRRLRYVQLDGKSLIHDFTSSFGHSTIVCFKMPPGFGVVADNTIKTICNVMGIEDLYCNVIRRETNRYNLVQAFIFGLTKQKTYQQIADEKGLNLVEFKEENEFFPKMIARPSNGEVRKREEIDPLEIMDFRQHMFGGRVFDTSHLDNNDKWLNSMNYARFLQIHHKHRAKLYVRSRLRRRYGEVESFLTLREKEARIKKFGKLPDRRDATAEIAASSKSGGL